MMIAMNEVYYGKTPNLLKAEQLIGSIKKEYDGIYHAGRKIVNDNRWKQVSTLLANEFGFKDYFLEVVSSPNVNASTYPISLAIECSPTFRLKKHLIVDRKGMKFNKDANLILTTSIFTGLLLNPALSAGEVLAVIIHEIGHNFQNVIDNKCFWLHDITSFTRILGVLLVQIMSMNIRRTISTAIQYITLPFTQSMFVRELQLKIRRSLEETDLRVLYDVSDMICNTFDTIDRNLGYLQSPLILLSKASVPVLIGNMLGKVVNNFVLNPLGYRQEKIADNFATMYGYGPELASAVMKFETEANNTIAMKKALENTFIGRLLDSSYGLLHIYSLFLDVHPASIERALDQVRYLKKELDRADLRKEQKAVIKKQIDEIERNLKNIMDYPDLDKHWSLIQYSFASLMYMNGGDGRHIFQGNDIYDNIQRTYDDMQSNP